MDTSHPVLHDPLRKCQEIDDKLGLAQNQVR